MEIRRDIRIAAPLEVLWELVSTPAGLAAWLGEGTDIDVREGGRGTVVDADGIREVRVTGVDAGRALAMEWWPAGRPDDASTVELELERDDDGDGPATRVHVVERRLPVAEPHQVEARAAAWSGRLRALACAGWGVGARRPALV